MGIVSAYGLPNPYTGTVRDQGGWVTSMAGAGFKTGAGNAAANDTLMAAVLAAMDAAGGGTLLDDLAGDTYFSARIVIPNSTGASFVGAIGSAVPTQHPFRFLGSRLRSTSGQAFGRWVLNYQTPNATSAAYSGPVAAGASKVFSAVSIPQGSFDIGAPVTVTDGTNQETATVTAVTVSGGNITSFTLDALSLSYASGTNNLTLSWPVLNDGKILSLGAGDFYIEGMTFTTTNSNDKTPFILSTNTRPYYRGNEIRGSNGLSALPGAIYTNQWPTGPGIILGGPRGTTDGSPSSGYAGYTGVVTDNLFFSVERAIIAQSLVTTTEIARNYVTSSCGSPSGIGAAIVVWTAASVANNNCTIHDNALEVCHYQQTIRLGNKCQYFTLFGNQHPDNVTGTGLNTATSALAATIPLNGWLPTVDLAPYLQSYLFAVEVGTITDLVRFTAMAATATTSLTALTAVGATSIQVASATGFVAGMGILVDSAGSYGGANGSAGVKEPAVIAASYVSGTTIPLVNRLVYSHANGASVQVGPFTATLQDNTKLAHAHFIGANVTPSLAAVRLDSGAVGNLVIMGQTDARMSVYDLNPGGLDVTTPSLNTVIALRNNNQADVSAFMNPVYFPNGLRGHLLAGVGGGVPTVVANAHLGTTGAANVAAGSNDTRGKVNLLPAGTTLAAGTLCAVTFGVPYATAPTIVLTTDAATGSVPALAVLTPSTTGFSVYTNTVPVAGTNWAFYYHVIG